MLRTRADLRAVQQRLIDELYGSEGVAVTLGMGGGKTVTALTALRRLLDDDHIRGAVVVAPKRVALDTWPTEVTRWEHLRGLRVGVLSGSPAQRARVLDDLRHDIWTVGVDLLPWLIEELKKRPDHPAWDQLVIDELSRFKSPRGSRAKALMRVVARFGGVWGLTGTPRPNSYEDLWMPLQIVSKGRAWGMSFDPWRVRHFIPLDYQQRRWAPRESALPAIHDVIDAWVVSVPPEETVDVPFISGEGFDVVVPLSPAAAADADEMARDLLITLGREGTLSDIDPDDDEVIAALSAAVASGKLSQIMQGYVYRDGVAAQRYEGGKGEAVFDFVEALDGEPLVICYWHTEDLAVLRELFGAELGNLGAGVSDKQAADTIERWNKGELPILALHPASAGHGLNLQFGGHRMLWMAMPWSAELYEQTIKRLARPGQRNPVFSHRLLADHPYERLRVARVEAKIGSQAEFIANLRSTI